MLHARWLNLEHIKAISILARRLAKLTCSGWPASHTSLSFIFCGYVVHDVQVHLLILLTYEFWLATCLADVELG